ncbi:hypothetical protein F751_0015 [Auxenochlorella protothecoides]|uniref:Uncharacterized protein n=1 Tax=Auxenochlorella protothecoides TaxID=3075 RepID=A0A087S9T4_AUXPR|nr:hypothetical protein F751_0015 [Auxenochlorella protothecoides]KFM22488.1 hypothetical protein F751_0015 [Auxenochlorella protothecoides]
MAAMESPTMWKSEVRVDPALPKPLCLLIVGGCGVHTLRRYPPANGVCVVDRHEIHVGSQTARNRARAERWRQ